MLQSQQNLHVRYHFRFNHWLTTSLSFSSKSGNSSELQIPEQRQEKCGVKSWKNRLEESWQHHHPFLLPKYIVPSPEHLPRWLSGTCWHFQQFPGHSAPAFCYHFETKCVSPHREQLLVSHSFIYSQSLWISCTNTVTVSQAKLENITNSFRRKGKCILEYF